MDSTYLVQGRTPEEIGAQLDSLGPRVDGRVFHGRHNARWRYQFDTEVVTGGLCRITRLAVLLRSVITLPELTGVDGTGSGVRGQWVRYHTALRRHEEGHHRITLRSIRDFRARAVRLRSVPCPEVADRLEELTQDTESERRSAQERYDRNTDYGRTQGATWPPPGAG